MSPAPIVITGASTGMGKAAALQLATAGHPLVLLLRDGAKARDAHAEIVQLSGNRAVELEHADLAVQADLHAAAQRITARHPALAGFISNAGAQFNERRLTPDGIERTLAVNHLAPFLLTHLLYDALKAHAATDEAPTRIVLTASSLQFPFDLDDYNRERSYDGFKVYGQTKLANIQFTKVLAQRLDGTGITVNCLAPGIVRTQLFRDAAPHARLLFRLVAPFLSSPERAGRKIVRLATDPALSETSGQYFAHNRPATPIAEALDENAQNHLWVLSERLTHTV